MFGGTDFEALRNGFMQIALQEVMELLILEMGPL